MGVHRTPVWRAYIAVCVMALCSSVADGQCTICGNECDSNAVVAPDGNVHKENVAYGKTARMSGAYTTNSNPACMAVNGRTSSTFWTVSPRNCIETDDNGLWQVDLGQSYTITSITIYRADDPNNGNIRRRMQGIQVWVDSQMCHQFPFYSRNAEYYNSLPKMITVNCSQPLTGQILRLVKRPSEEYKVINICEVQVWACKTGHYGSTCESCPSNCDDTGCVWNTGDCNSCKAGYWGEKCDKPCLSDNCKNKKCYQHNGACIACQTNFEPPDCKNCKAGFYGADCEQCPISCENSQCNGQTGHCVSCPPGYYGDVCNMTCPTDKCLNNRCNQDNGQCADCMTGYYGPQCRPCSPNCDVTGCVWKTGDCYSCKAGYWGVKCDKPCMSGNCRDNECYQNNGACRACRTNFEPPHCTICIRGYFGENCNQSCVSSDCEDGRCDRDNGQCPACDAGFWGDNCDKSCLPRRCAGNRCDQMTGSCPTSCDTNFLWPDCTECIVGHYTTTCDQACLSSHCENNRCDQQTGQCSSGCEGNFSPPDCTECIAGYYTTTCNQTCLSSHCENNKCDQQTGQCSSGCEGNFSPPDCTECEDNYYGPACITQCGKCVKGTVCNSTDGTCPLGCVDGYQAPQCLEEQASTGGPDHLIAIGISASGAVLFIAIIAIIVIVVVRRRQGKKTQEENAPSKASAVNDEDTDVEKQDTKPLSTKPRTEEAPKPKPKPQIAVKPILHRLYNKDKEDGDGGHVYMNLTSVTATDDGSSRADTQVSAEATDSTDRNGDRSVEASGITTSFATGGHGGSSASLASADQSMDDDGDYYNNTHVMFSSFRDTRPRLDEVQRHLVERLASTELVDKFHALDTNSGAPRDMASLPVNMKKNRFASILPYDANRVVLKDGYKKGGSTDYVNASYIQGYNSERMYIATQGPRDNTAVDFWRMVWQEHITHIVMLANVKELGKDKCFEYWPGEKKKVTYGPITITSVDVESRANFEVRTFSMKRTRSRDERAVVQYHYVTWPDHGAPSTTPLVSFWHYVRTRARDGPDAATVPTLVHCSAGVGRTGTFIGLDLGMDQAVREGEVDVEQIVIRLRQERCCMVQASEQFVFLHKALLEAYTARDFIMAVDKFSDTFPQPVNAHTKNHKIDREFETLMQMRSLAPEQESDAAEEAANVDKNRHQDVLPPDDHLVYLTEHVRGRNQYINAVYMSTMRDRKGCILTQLPLPNTLLDFWRMVWGQHADYIVSLATRDEERELTPYCWFWPRTSEDKILTGPYTVSLETTTQIGDHITHYTLKLEKESVTSSRDVHVLRYDDWVRELPGNTSDMIRLVDTLHDARTDDKGTHTIVQCSDGVAKSTLFSVISDVIDRMTYDEEIDVYMTVRNVQSVRPQAVTSVVQYRFCYEVVQQRLRESRVYVNT